MTNFLKKLMYSELPLDKDYSWAYYASIIWGVGTQGIFASILFLFAWDSFSRLEQEIKVSLGSFYLFLFWVLIVSVILFIIYFVITTVTKYRITMKSNFYGRYSVYTMSSIITQHAMMILSYCLLFAILVLLGFSI